MNAAIRFIRNSLFDFKNSIQGRDIALVSLSQYRRHIKCRNRAIFAVWKHGSNLSIFEKSVAVSIEQRAK